MAVSYVTSATTNTYTVTGSRADIVTGPFSVGQRRQSYLDTVPPPIGTTVRLDKRSSGMSGVLAINGVYTVAKSTNPERLAKYGHSAFAVAVPGKSNSYVYGHAEYTIMSLPTEMDPKMSDAKCYTQALVIKTVETIDGWVGQVVVATTIVWQSEPVLTEAPPGTDAGTYDPSDLAAKEAEKHLQSKFA